MAPFPSVPATRARVPEALSGERPAPPRREPRGGAQLATLLALAVGCARLGFEDLGLPTRDPGSALPADGGSTELDAATPSAPNDGGEPDGTQPDGSAPPALPDAGANPQVPADASADAATPAPTPCSLAAPERLGSPNYTGNNLWSPSLSSDRRSLFFAVLVPGWVEEAARRVKGVTSARVNLVFDPPWTPAKMSDEAKLELNML